MGQAAGIWWDAVSGGAFYNRWSAALSFVAATVVGVPTLQNASIEGYAKAVVVAALGWLILAAIVTPAAIAERRLSSRTARGVVVLAALLVVTAIRAALNDALAVAVWGIASTGAFGPRSATNIASGFVMFSLVAVALSQYAHRRAIGARLEGALAPMRAHLQRAQEQAAVTSTMLASTVDRLRAERERMLSGEVDFDAVRAYSDEVRAESHRFEARAREIEAVAGAPEATGAVSVRHRQFAERLVPTPWLTIGLVYVVVTLPFALDAGGVRIAVFGVLGVCAIDLVVGAAVRWALPRPGSALRPYLYMAVWVLAGVAVAALTRALLPHIGVIALVGIVTIPLLVVVVSLCVDALRVARVAANSAEELLTRAAQFTAGETARVTDLLRQAVGLLHGRVQGRCVILAAHADDGTPTPEQLAEFRAQTDDAFDRMLGPVNEQELKRGGAGGVLGPIDRIVAAWRAVMEISLRTSPEAAVALEDRQLSERAADIVNEALVNAVKHSGARVARVDVDVTGDRDLRVRVASPGRLTDPSRRVAGIGMRRPGVSITQVGEDVVLDAVLPATTGAVSRVESAA